MKKVMVAFLLILLMPTYVNAYFCDFEDLSRLKKIASNINTNIEYTEEEDNAKFTVKFYNLNQELYIVDTSTNKKYSYDDNQLSISGYNSGEKLVYNIYAEDENCNNKVIRTIRINLPNYNKYYKDKLCIGIEDYTLCKKWARNNYSYEKFRQKINDYKNKEETVSEPQVSYKKYPVLEFISQYYYIFLIIIIIGCGFGIYKLNKKSDIYS